MSLYKIKGSHSKCDKGFFGCELSKQVLLYECWRTNVRGESLEKSRSRFIGIGL